MGIKLSDNTEALKILKAIAENLPDKNELLDILEAALIAQVEEYSAKIAEQDAIIAELQAALANK